MQLLLDLKCRRRVIVVGMGSLYVERKIAATLASIATSVFIKHPIKAGYGGLGCL